jgi:hypothetical protein
MGTPTTFHDEGPTFQISQLSPKVMRHANLTMPRSIDR